MSKFILRFIVLVVFLSHLPHPIIGSVESVRLPSTAVQRDYEFNPVSVTVLCGMMNFSLDYERSSTNQNVSSVVGEMSASQSFNLTFIEELYLETDMPPALIQVKSIQLSSTTGVALCLFPFYTSASINPVGINSTLIPDDRTATMPLVAFTNFMNVLDSIIYDPVHNSSWWNRTILSTIKSESFAHVPVVQCTRGGELVTSCNPLIEDHSSDSTMAVVIVAIEFSLIICGLLGIFFYCATRPRYNKNGNAGGPRFSTPKIQENEISDREVTAKSDEGCYQIQSGLVSTSIPSVVELTGHQLSRDFGRDADCLLDFNRSMEHRCTPEYDGALTSMSPRFHSSASAESSSISSMDVDVNSPLTPLSQECSYLDPSPDQFESRYSIGINDCTLCIPPNPAVGEMSTLTKESTSAKPIEFAGIMRPTSTLSPGAFGENVIFPGSTNESLNPSSLSETELRQPPMLFVLRMNSQAPRPVRSVIKPIKPILGPCISFNRSHSSAPSNSRQVDPCCSHTESIQAGTVSGIDSRQMPPGGRLIDCGQTMPTGLIPSGRPSMQSRYTGFRSVGAVSYLQSTGEHARIQPHLKNQQDIVQSDKAVFTL